MIIRNLKETDLPHLIEFVKNCEELTLERNSIFWLFWKFFRNTSFVVIKDEKIIGLLLGFLDQVDGKAGFIHELGVHSEFRKQGIATNLIKEFERVIQSLGGKNILLTTLPTNLNAIHFYQKIGFNHQKNILKVGQERIEFQKQIN